MTVIEEKKSKIIFDWERLEKKAIGKPTTSFEGCSSFNLRIKGKRKNLSNQKNSDILRKRIHIFGNPIRN